jgi:hypothetical protein
MPGERDALIPPSRPKDVTYGGALAHAKVRHSTAEDEDVVIDVARYRTQAFSTWSAFTISDKTVWRNGRVWSMMARLALVSLAVAMITVFVVRRPALLKVGKFTDVSKFLNVVTGLLLGFFLSSSMNRWYTCVDGFLELLDSIRNLQIQFIALGVPTAETILVLRYGLLSGWLVFFRLIQESKQCHEKLGEQDEIWAAILGMQFDLTGHSNNKGFVHKDELMVLQRCRDPPPMLWVWVAGLIGRLAQDGLIPPMASPTYGRIMNLCQAAHAGIRQVNVSIMVQYPLIYTHLLATLVHLNNLLNAITFGIVLGLSIGTWLQRREIHPVYAVSQREIAEGESQRDVQTAIVTFMYCCIGPIIYQALLLISMALAQPFDSDEASIPLDRFLKSLEQDLKDGFLVAENMSFDKPCFAPGKSMTARPPVTPPRTPRESQQPATGSAEPQT